ncbi:MAG: hypothetical protein N2A42_07165 [Luteolibacter sp.]
MKKPQQKTVSCICVLIPGILALSILGSGCLMKRTVHTNGRQVEEKYVVKRPIKNLIKNTEIE